MNVDKTSLFRIIIPFIQEIEERKKKKINLLDLTLSEEKSRILHTKETTIKELNLHYSNEAKVKSEREYARIVEAARLKAKKILFDAINADVDTTFTTIRKELTSYTQKPEYKRTLERMVEFAKLKLDQDMTIHCRDADNILLKKLNISIGPSIQTLGGILAENKDGTKELDLTFEELLRTHEDDVKNFLLERMIK